MFERGLVEKIEAEITALNVREESLIAECQAKTAEAATAEASAGEKFLDGAGESTLKRVLELRGEVELRERAITALAGRRAAAEDRLKAAGVEVLRQAQRAKKEELESLQRKTAKALETLGLLEGIKYTARILSAEPHGVISPYQGQTAYEFLHPREYTLDVGGGYYKPRSRQLTEEIAELEARIP